MSREQSENLFNRLVENALDFLNRAVAELEDSPKYSVIHFNTAVELFLKARLMHEHWSLVVSKRTEPEWEKFVAGDFQSVALDEAATRLEKIVGSGLTAQELKVFKEVAKHRNKIMHFFHEAHSEEAEDHRRQSIAKEQLHAWYFLSSMLRKKWSKVFAAWSDQISDIDRALKRHRGFLQVAFDQLKYVIETERTKGAFIEACLMCKFEALPLFVELNEIDEATCPICDFAQGFLDMECTECEATVQFRGDGFSTCESCGKDYEPEDLIDIVEDSASSHIAIKDDDDSRVRGNCGNCDGYETLVRPTSDHECFVCVSCLQKFYDVEQCQWCNAPNSGDMSNGLLPLSLTLPSNRVR